jgi:cytidine deaminase
MKELNLHIQVIVKQEDELTTQELALLDEARRATYRSYAPYSHFSVGAAVELADGTLVPGSNQENAAYPSGLCAERTAVFYAGSQYPDQPIRRLCIAARDTNGEFLPRPISPCGACRQVMLEAEQRAGQPIEVMLYGTEGIYFIHSIQDLLPLSFDDSFLS